MGAIPVTPQAESEEKDGAPAMLVVREEGGSMTSCVCARTPSGREMAVVGLDWRPAEELVVGETGWLRREGIGGRRPPGWCVGTVVGKVGKWFSSMEMEVAGGVALVDSGADGGGVGVEAGGTSGDVSSGGGGGGEGVSVSGCRVSLFSRLWEVLLMAEVSSGDEDMSCE